MPRSGVILGKGKGKGLRNNLDLAGLSAARGRPGALPAAAQDAEPSSSAQRTSSVPKEETRLTRTAMAKHAGADGSSKKRSSSRKSSGAGSVASSTREDKVRDPAKMSKRLQEAIDTDATGRAVEKILRKIMLSKGDEIAMLQVCAPPIVLVLQTYMSEGPIVATCFDALAKVCTKDEGTKSYVLENGQPDELFLQATQIHSQDAMIMAQACKFLAVVVRENTFRVDATVFDVLFEVMSANQEAADTFGYAGTAIAAFIHRDSETEFWCQRFEEFGGVAVALAGFRKTTHSELAVYSVFQLLATAADYINVAEHADLDVSLIEASMRRHEIDRIRRYGQKLLEMRMKALAGPGAAFVPPGRR